MVRFNDKPQIENSALSDTDIMPITDLEDSASDKKISIGQLKEYLSENLTNFADIDLVNTDMLADAIIEAPNGVIVANSSNNAIIAKQGLKLLFANGRKANNKFNNLEYTLQSDISQSVVSMANGNYVVFLTSAGSLGYIPITEIYVSSEQPQVSTTNAYWYDVISNYWKRTSTSGATWVNTIINILGQVTITNNLLTTVTPNTLAYIPIPETLTIRDLSNITTAGEKRIKDLVQPNINTTVNNASNTINARIDSVNSNLQTQISQNRADINTLDVGGAIEKTPSKLKTALLLSTLMDKPISDVDIFNILMDKKHSTFDRSKFTVVGTPSITDDGVVSGFNNNTSISIPSLTSSTFNKSNTWVTEGVFLCKKQSEQSIWSTIMSTSNTCTQVTWRNDVNTVYGYLSFDGTAQVNGRVSVPNLKYNTFYKIRFEFTGAEYILTVYNQDGSVFGQSKYVSSEKVYTSNISYKYITNTTANDVIVADLKYASVLIDGIEVFNGNKTGVDQIKKDDYTNPNNVPISQDGIIDITNEDFTSITTPTLDLSNPSIVFKGSFIKTGNVTKLSAGIAIFHTLSATNETNTFIRLTSPNNDVLNLQIMKNNSYIFNAKIGDIVRNKKYFIEYKYEVDRWIVTVKDEIGAIRAYREIISDYNLTNSVKYIPNNPSQYGSLVGYIDLNDVKVYSDGNLVYQPTLRIPYTLSKTNEKIVDAVYRDRVQDMYEQFGYTHYYTIGDVPEKYNVQVVGNPTLVGGIYSSSNNYNVVNVDLSSYMKGKNNIKISFEMTVSDYTQVGSFVGGENNKDTSFINAYWNGTGGTDVRFFMNNETVSQTISFNDMSLNGLYKWTYTLTNSDAKLDIIKPDGVQGSKKTNRKTPNDTFDTGCMILRLGYLSGANIDLKTLSVVIDGKEVFRGYEPKIVDAYTLATHKNGDIIETFSDNAGTYYEVRADLVQRCVGIIPPQTTQVNYPRAFKEDTNIVQVSYFDVGDSTSTLTLDHIAPKTQTKSGFTIGSTQTANRNYYAEGKAVLG